MRLNILWPLLLAATTAYAQPAFNDLQKQAEAALVANQPDQTIRLAQQMLDVQPDSFAALYLLALAQADLNDLQMAAQTGMQAYHVATTEDRRFQAARFVGSVRFQAAQYTRSEMWLRRAANHTQTNAELQSVAEAFAISKQANPLSMRFAGSIAPTDNINNGSKDGVLRLEGIDVTFVLPEDRRSLSGVAFTASTELRYRVAQSPAQSTTLIGAISGATYALSSDAKDLLASSPNPDVRAVDGSDFATVTALAGVERQQNNISPLGPVRAGLSFGSYWEGAERLVDFHDLSLEQIVPVGRDRTFRLKGLVREQLARTPNLLDSTRYDLMGSYAQTLRNGDQLQLSLQTSRVLAGAENSFDEYEVGVGYGLAQPIFGVQLYTSLQFGYRTYDEFVTTLDGRDDHFISADATATFQDVSYFGFSPSITVSSSRTVSTAEENTTSAVQVLFGVTSNF
ncbi:hypothetical protein [Roseobacter sp. CCS2]|uniref:hypothetical protein n=1 Tax=Roseobacter sp. CCS2 TaxID=391593 RepID=UPI0000F4053A|nr:hypothetical protein [Roseobacter sp. CCS2]EBA13875.1 hypothetical protein RCCS2_08299 [Roseobacter sp. CCS2]